MPTYESRLLGKCVTVFYINSLVWHITKTDP
jgi:hypothetical protein